MFPMFVLASVACCMVGAVFAYRAGQRLIRSYTLRWPDDVSHIEQARIAYKFFVRHGIKSWVTACYQGWSPYDIELDLGRALLYLSFRSVDSPITESYLSDIWETWRLKVHEDRKNHIENCVVAIIVPRSARRAQTGLAKRQAYPVFFPDDLPNIRDLVSNSKIHDAHALRSALHSIYSGDLAIIQAGAFHASLESIFAPNPPNNSAHLAGCSGVQRATEEVTVKPKQDSADKPITLAPSSIEPSSSLYPLDRIARHEYLKQEVRRENPKVIFVGDSLTDQWRTAGSNYWRQYFEPIGAAEIGIGGDRAEHLLWRILDGAIDEIEPRCIVVCIGTNDIPLKAPARTAASIQRMCYEIRARLPSAQLLLLSLPPFGRLASNEARGIVQSINDLLERQAKAGGFEYLDCSRFFLSEDGKFADDLSDDGIHLTPKGYSIWGTHIFPVLQRLLEKSMPPVQFRIEIKTENGRAASEAQDTLVSSANDAALICEPLKTIESANLSGHMIKGNTWHFVYEKSDLLWVFLTPRGSVESRFAYFREGQKLPGSKLFLRTPIEDFYQSMFEDIIAFIADLRDGYRFRRVIYVGFSAGAYAALVLGMRCEDTQRVLAFAPQFRLDHPLTIAHQTLAPWRHDGSKYDPRYADIVNEVGTSTKHIDIFLGVYAAFDGIMVEESLKFVSPSVKCHYVRWHHDVGAQISRAGALPGIMEAAQCDKAIVLPPNLVASNQEVVLAARTYAIMKALEFDGLPVDVPTDDDRGCQNPDWWNVKARIRRRQKDPYGAIADFMRSIILAPDVDGGYISLGHCFRELGQFALATAAYEVSRELNPKGWGGTFGLAATFSAQKRWLDAESALQEASKLGAPDPSISSLRGVIKAGIESMS